MFRKNLEVIDRLNTDIPLFSYLYKKYTLLEKEIASFKAHKELQDDLFWGKTYQRLKQQKNDLHKEIYWIVRKVKC